MISASIVADSISPQSIYPWFIHGELMTHRVFSRNASSNRAVPLAKMLEEARRDDLRAEPVFWGAEQRGMSPGGELSDIQPAPSRNDPFPLSPLVSTRMWWKHAALHAATCAEAMASYGAHKSLCNRLLMPFTHANVIVTSIEWDNFFGLRLHKDADPTMRALAVAMWDARKASVPAPLAPGQWHLPLADNPLETYINASGEHPGHVVRELRIKVSVARCARVSYESFETGKRSTVEEDLRLYDRLVGAEPLHASPAEHQATPDEPLFGDIPTDQWRHPEQHGNFRGWRQYRQMLPGQAVAPLPEEYLS